MSEKVVKDIYSGISVNTSQAIRCLQLVTESNTTAMLWGPYGIGKTAIVYQIANALKEVFDGCIVINPSQDDVIDFKLPYTDEVEEGVTISRFAYSERLPRKGRWFVFVDEINTCSQAMQATLYSLILEGRIGNYHLPEGCIRIAAGNRENDRCAAQPMSAALKDRLGLHLNVYADSTSWCNWGSKNNIVPELLAFIRNFPGQVMGHDPDDPTGGCTPRSLTSLSKKLEVGIPAEIESVVLAGSIGQAAGVMLGGFLDVYRQNIDIDYILSHPLQADVPLDRADILYSIATAIGAKMNKENIGNAVEYLRRMPKTYYVVAISDAVNRDMSLKRTKEFITAITENKHIIWG
jgi:energy-coupling factor transporter ATP-binding protein EcfA2